MTKRPAQRTLRVPHPIETDNQPGNQYRTMNWPPPYTLRYSKRARRISLHIRPGTGLELVLPDQTPEADGLRLLHKHRRWVERHLTMTEPQTQQPWPPQSILLHGGAMKIHLQWGLRFTSGPAMGELFPLNMTSDVSSPIPQPESAPLAGSEAPIHLPYWHYQPERHALLRLKTSTQAAMAESLRAWLKRYAKTTLEPRLRSLAHRYNLHYMTLRIALQKSRWGSYSSRGVLSLNAKLVFLPDELSRMILLHELCHSRHMNHGEAFWLLLESLEPEAKTLDRTLAAYGHSVPHWVEPRT